MHTFEVKKKKWQVLTNKYALEIPLCPFSSLTCFPFTPHAHLTPRNHFSDLHRYGLVLSMLEPHINRVTWYGYILQCLVTLAEVSESYSHCCMCWFIPFFFIESYHIKWMYHGLFIILLLTDTWVASSLGLLWIKLLWTFLYEFFFFFGHGTYVSVSLG